MMPEELPTLSGQLERLRDQLERVLIAPQDIEFVTSLLNASQRGALSPRQQQYVTIVYQRYNSGAGSRTTLTPSDEFPGVSTSDTLRCANAVEARLIAAYRAPLRDFDREMIALVRANRGTPRQRLAFWRMCLVHVPDTLPLGVREWLSRHSASTSAQPTAVLNLGTQAAPASAVTESLTNAARLFALFDNARRHMRDGSLEPRLQMQEFTIRRDPRDVLTIIRRATEPSRRIRLAELNREGLLTGAPGRPFRMTAPQVALLRRLCDAPEDTLHAEGRRTNTCCMCARGLTDERSVNLGMGPVCAGRWGLSHAWLAARGATVPNHNATLTPENSALVNADYSAIEARVDALIADQPTDEQAAEFRRLTRAGGTVTGRLRDAGSQARAARLAGIFTPATSAPGTPPAPGSMLMPGAPDQDDF